MKKTRRWLALLLAVILVGSNALYQIGTSMSASETDTTAESGQQDDSAAVPETQDQDTASLDQQNNTGGVQVQEVTPQTRQKETTSQSEAAKTQQVQPAQNNASASDKNTQAAPSAEPVQETPEEKTYHVTIQKSDVDGGTIKAWGSDGNKTDVTYNSENKYVKEVKEGEDFNFEITAKDTYKVAKVTDQNGTTIEPKAVNNNVYTYEVKNITAERTYSITYAKEEVKKAESTSNGDQQKSDDEQSEDADDDGEPAAKAQENVNVVSDSDDKEKVESAAETHKDTDTEKWITVGDTVKLSNEYESTWLTTYNHSWKIKEGNDVVTINSSKSNSISVKGKKAGKATITDTITWRSWGEQQEKTIIYTIHVSEAVAPTAITISGADKVTQFKTAQLTYELTPSNAAGEVQWSSSNEQILTVDSNGLVSGLRQGTATVTASVQDKESNSSVFAEKTIQVVANEESTDEAIVYYLVDPTKDANSNHTDNWGPQYGIATVNTTGATWTNNKNCFDNVDQRVVSWPNGTNVVTRGSDAWNQIFENYRSSIQSQLGVKITKDDVEEITLVPAKISRNNQGTVPDKHLDCNVNIKCKNVATVKYYLYDAGAVKFDMLGSKNYVINGTSKTQPSDVTSKTFPATKTVNGVTYTFSGWYTNQDLTNAAPAFPAKVESSITYYAKYIAGYHVMYNLAGGKFSDGSTNATEKHNEGTNVVVKEEPTRKGYKFTGWTVGGLDNTTTISSGESFTMPGNTVTLTANWEEQKIKDFISLTPTDAERVYNGEPLAAGTAKVSAKKVEANLDGVKIEYQKADKTWTDNPAEITATNVADSTTVKVRVTSEKYTGKLEDTEKLTITKRPIEIKAANASKTYGEVDPAFADATMSGQVTGELTDVDLTVSRSDADNDTLGTHEDVLSISQSKEALEEAYTNYTFTIKPADFTVNENETALTVSAKNVTQTYDGTAYGVTAVASIGGATIKYKDADGNYTLDASPTKKNVGEKEVEFEASLYGYKTVTGKAKITITKRPVEITVANDEKYYGTEDPEFASATMSGQVAGELTDVDLSVIRTNASVDKVGTYKDVLTIKSNKEELEKANTNYTFTITPGTFKIKTNDQGALKVSAADVTQTYDGTAYGVAPRASIEGAAITYKDADGNYTLDASPTRTDAGETTVEFKASLEGYADAFGSATITINKRPVEIKAANASKTYGEVDPAFADATMEGQVTGELNDVDLTVSRSDAGDDTLGTHKDVLSISQSKGALEEAYTNYTFTIKPADFTVNENETALTVSAKNVTQTYDGTAYGVTAVASIDGATIKYKDKDGKYTLDASPTKKNVGEKEVEFEASLYGYKTVTGKAKVTITKRPVTITAANSWKYYGNDDPAFEDAIMQNQVAGELTDVDLSVIRSNAQVNKVGTYEKVLTINSSKKELEKEYTNYTFTINPGTFEIKTNDQNVLQVGAVNVKKPYDGQSLGVEAEATLEGAVIKYKDADGNYTLDASPTRTNVGTTTVEFKASLEGYADAFGSATITIEKRPVEIKAANASKTYGEVDPAFADAIMSGQVTGELTDVDLTVSRSDADNDTLGTHEDVLSISQSKEALEEAYTNYTFTIKPADFTINTNEDALTVSAEDVTKTYDGTSYGVTAVASIGGATIKYKDADGNYTLDASPTKKNVGEKEVEFEASLYGYKTVTGKAKITITKRPVEITVANAEKYYGTADPEFEDATMSGQVTGELTDVDLSVIRSNAQVNKVGTYIDVLTINSSKKELEKANTNYTFTINLGTFEIKTNDQGALAVSAANVEKTYDGNASGVTPSASIEGATITYKDTNGNYTLTESPTRTDVGETTVEFKASLEGYADAFGSATITINKRPVEIKAANASKTYGEVDPAFADAIMSGQVTGELTDVDLTVSRSDADNDTLGTHEDVLSISQSKEALEEAYTNYTFTIKPADFTINTNEDALTVSAADVTKTYDGTAYGVTAVASIDGATIKYKDKDGKYTLDASPTKKNVGEKEVEFEASLYGYKTVTGKAKVTITKRPVTITTPTQSKVYDTTPLTAEGTIEGIVEGETATFTTTGSQTEVGNSKNTYTLTWDGTAKETNYTVSDSVGTLEVTKQSIVPDPNNPESYKDVTIDDPSDATYDGKEHKWSPVVTDKDGNELKEGTDYEVSYSKDDFTNVTGEIKVTITGKGNYTGTVDKTYQITPKAVIITTDSDTRAFNDQPLTAPGRVDGIVAGETYGFTVTGTQTYVGSSANSYQMTWAKKGENKYTAKKSNYKVEENIGTLTVTDGTPENPVTPSLVVNKTHDTDKTYKAGDVITFTITVKNIYDEAKTITLEEQEGVTLDKTTFENVKPGKEITASAAYTVTEADIVNGTFTNNVKATFSGVDKEYTGTDTVDKFEESRPHMTITKVTKDAGKNHIYKLGETINYVITVKNDGNLTLTNVKIEDALTGNAGENAWTIDTFAPGETQTFETSYVVTEADVIAGKVVNNATGEAENPDPKKEETPVTPGEKEDPVETPNPGLTVVKTSDAEGRVTLGQKITYTITVTNNGNVTISGVKLDDSLTGDNWTLGNIKPGETVTKKTTYTVTEKDIIAGKVENHATATGKDPGGKDITGEGEKTVTTEESNPQITVTKETTSTPKNGKTYALGEKITYKITAKNTGNLTLTDVTVSDKLTGNTGDKAFKIDGKFKPGEEATFEASYTVKESDLGKTVVNEATAAGKTTDPKNPEPGVTPGTTEDPVDQKNPAMTITKKVTDKKEEYQIGDTVKYEITVKNTGNTTQNNVLVEDRMNAAGSAVITKVEGAKGTIDGANVTLDTLAPGKEATIKAEYTVVKEDRGNTITNAAVAKGEGETPVTPEVPVDVEDVYDIHVTHVFADGEESSAALPEDYDIENLKPGTTKLLNAEEVNGYTAYPAAQRVTIEEEDVTVTFVYYKDAIGTDPANPDQPDNIPDRYQAVVKFEAVNGTVNIDHAVVTLFDENNEPAENGVGHLSLLQIANATADAGYDQSSLSWAPETPTIRYEITGEMTFTASFTATPATPGTTPANPTNPTPATPSTPANPAPSAPANQTPARSTNIITRAAEAIADGAERIASDVREVLNNDDEDVPLAKQKLDDHKCCILHFLIMLLAAILYGFYTHNMKKRQKKMFEAREELDLELARRGLPTTKEQEQM